MSFSDFSSWPREQEQAFVVYEQRVTDSQRKAWTIGGVCAGVLLVFALGIYFGVSPQHTESKEATSSVTKKDAAKDAPAAEKK